MQIPGLDPKNLKLATLAHEVSTCNKCYNLCSSRKQTVFGEGNRDARVMIIGEAPGQEEDKLGRPFVGKAGNLLDNMLSACRWKRENVYIANILKCRPPNNRVPELEEIHNCSRYLEDQIAAVNPEFILCLGSVASHTLIGLPISQARGNWYYYKHHKVICTYHPAYLLRKGTEAKKIAWQDLQKLLDALNH